jgi:hypothetical protein
MVALPEAGSGVRYRVARYTDIYLNEADDPIEAAREAFANMEHSDQTGDLPILEVTELATNIVTDVDLQDHFGGIERDEEDGSDDD